MSTLESEIKPAEPLTEPPTPFQALEARLTALENAVHGLSGATVTGGQSHLQHLLDWIKARV